jgi:hypothetical protein
LKEALNGIVSSFSCAVCMLLSWMDQKDGRRLSSTTLLFSIEISITPTFGQTY